jgi:hypothetical protein
MNSSLSVLLLVALAPFSGRAAEVTPIQKVLEMMESMLAKGKSMKHEEEVEFAKFKQWCDDTRSDSTRSIKEAADELTQLTADIGKAGSDAEVLDGEVKDLNKEVDTLEVQAASAKAVRDKEHKIYSATHLDFSESVDAIAKAVSVLKSRGADVPQSLMQVSRSKMLPAEAKSVLESFLSVSESADSAAPEANAYESQSGGVISMLEKLKIKFEDQRRELEKEEMNSRANHQMLMQQLTDDIKADKEAASTKTAAKAGRLEDAAQAKGDKAATETQKATDEKTLSDTTAQCRARSEEYENNQVTRNEEIQAIQKAIEIISSDKVQGTAQERLPSSLLQSPKKRSAFAALRRSSNESPEARQRAVNYLQAQAAKLGSHYLSVVAAHTQGDAFAKVKKMIKDLLTKLMEEANSEADQHGYCTAELATNKQTRDIKSSEVEELTANIEKTTSTIEQLSTEITDLADALSELKGKQSEATNLRSTEKKTNAQAVAEAKEAQSAVTQAIKVLQDFYAAQKDGAALMQNDAKDIESMSSAGKEPYKGMQAGSGGIIGMLEVVLSDFARLETETSEAEAQAQRAYDSFMNESTEDAAVKETTKKHKENNRDRATEQNRGLKKEIEMTQSELDSAMDYYDKLKGECLDTGLSYEERKKMREEELVSLQEALKILSGEDI